MHRLLFILITLGSTIQSFSQTITVKDAITLDPVPFASISCYSGSTGFVFSTNKNGKATVKKCQSNLKIESLGYEPVEIPYPINDTIVLLQPSVIVLSEVNVFSGKASAGNRIHIPKKDILLHNPTTSADLIGLSDKVYIQKSQLGGGSPMINGFAANRVLITVDGVRMNNAIFRSGNLQNIISLDPWSVHSADVFFGPGSVLYGSDAIGGVMHLHTHYPLLSTDSSMQVDGRTGIRYSSASFENTGHIDFNIGLKKWAFLTNITYSLFDDLRMGSHGPDRYLRDTYADRINGQDTTVINSNPEEQVGSGYNQFNIIQKIHFEPTDNWVFNYGFYYATSSDIPRYDRLIQKSGNDLKYGEWFYGPQKWMMHVLGMSHRAKRGLFDFMSSRIAFQQFEESRHTRRFGTTTRTNRIEKVNVFSADLDFTTNLYEQHTLRYGFEALYNQVGSSAFDEDMLTGNTSSASTRYPDGADWTSIGIYALHEWRFHKKINLTTAIRYNHVIIRADFDTTFFPFPFTETRLSMGNINGSTGLVYTPGKNWRMYLNALTGFRAPNIDDIGKVFDSEPGAVVVPNPGLQAEYAWHGSAGIEKQFADRVKIDLNAYYTLLDNAIVRRDFTFNGQDSIAYDGTLSRVQALQNSAEARVWGLQAGVALRLPAGFSLESRINYQKGVEELDDGSTSPLRHAAPLFGSTHFTYTRNKLKVDFYSNYNGSIDYENLAISEQGKPHLYALDKNGNPYYPSWMTLNLKALYTLSESFTVSGGVENITDVRYRTYSSGIVAPGRNIILSLMARF